MTGHENAITDPRNARAMKPIPAEPGAPEHSAVPSGVAAAGGVVPRSTGEGPRGRAGEGDPVRAAVESGPETPARRSDRTDEGVSE